MGDLIVSLGRVVICAVLVTLYLAFRLAPGLMLRIILKAYPKGHERRREWVAEWQAVPNSERPVWLASLIRAALIEGPPARWTMQRQMVRRAFSLLGERLQVVSVGAAFFRYFDFLGLYRTKGHIFLAALTAATALVVALFLTEGNPRPFARAIIALSACVPAFAVELLMAFGSAVTRRLGRDGGQVS
ncbi:MAG: hypothetical protein LBC97_07640 [Bifidobacteriaceae bacterium]|jgi:hypothetical protein|nr:hypothetical protein [Bifidobacteriaceae bacterium]